MSTTLEARRRDTRTGVSAFFIMGFGTVLGYVVNTMLARTFGPAGYGLFVVYLAAANIFCLLTRCGFGIATLRFLPVVLKDGYPGEGWHLLRWTRSVTCAIWLVLMAILATPPVRALFFRTLGLNGPMLALAGTSGLLLAHAQLEVRLLEVLGKVRRATTASHLLRPGLLGGALLLGGMLGWLGQGSDAKWALWCEVTAQVGLLGTLVVMRRKATGTWPAVERALDPQVRSKWSRTAVLVALYSSGFLVLRQVDVLCLRALTDRTTVGIYGAGLRFTQALSLVLLATTTYAGPRISVLYQAGDGTGLLAFYRSVWRLSLVLALPLWVFLMVAARPLLGLFGAEFVSGATCLQILATGQFLNVVIGPVDYLLTMTGREAASTFLVAGACVANLSLNILLIPRYGMEGAAIATVISIFAWKAGMFFYARKTVFRELEG